MTAMPAWAAAPFAAVLVAVVLGPVAAPKAWHKAGVRLAVFGLAAAPAALLQWTVAPIGLAHAAEEYLAFLLLLAALYQLAAGIVVEGPLTGQPISNALLLLGGAVLANAIGTTGASMLLLPIVLRANAGRQHVTHLVIFLIFIVSNQGGMLTPLGDPPLYLGYLRGVPFFWTLRLWPAFALSVGALLAVLMALDRRYWRAESVGARALSAARAHDRWQLRGWGHIAGFAAVLTLVSCAPALSLPGWATSLLLLGVATVAYRTASPAAHARNGFSWEPLQEIAVLFGPLFFAMPPALAVLRQHADLLPLSTPEAFYWSTGALSAVLDNAPCYVSMATLAQVQAGLGGPSLLTLSQSAQGAVTLAAIAHGAVSMGAMTYIGNGPNLMVRQSAVASGVRMPGFVGYIGWALAFLLPVLWGTRRLMGLL